MLYIFDKHVYFVTRKITKQYLPWLTNSVKIMMKKRDSALIKFKKTKLPTDWVYYRQLRNYCVSIIKKEKAAFLSQHSDNNKML